MQQLAYRFLALFLFIFVGLNPSAFSCNKDESEGFFQPCEKTYISPDQLGMTTQGIFVQLGDSWFQTKSIHFDSQGIFINNLKRGECGEERYFPCRNCGRCVHDAYDICPYCARPT